MEAFENSRDTNIGVECEKVKEALHFDAYARILLATERRQRILELMLASVQTTPEVPTEADLFVLESLSNLQNEFLENIVNASANASQETKEILIKFGFIRESVVSAFPE